jgi:hypothetical protein
MDPWLTVAGWLWVLYFVSVAGVLMLG